MNYPFVQIDAFTRKPFQGNPAAVFVLDQEKPAEWMQKVAQEMNLSETAFLLKRQDNEFQLRWFTPTVEVELCGHGTLASAFHLFSEGLATREHSIHFHTQSGLLQASLKDGFIELDFPSFPIKEGGPIELIQNAIGQTPSYVGTGTSYVARLKDEIAVRELQPNFSLIRQLGSHGLLVTAPGKSHDFVSRCFFPESGINEDPVTGSAHCLLVSYWQAELGKNTFQAYQASMRGGEIQIELRGDRALLRGTAVRVISGQLELI